MGKNLNEALELITKALELSPNKGYIIDSLGWTYFKLGDLNKALELLLKAASLSPKDPAIYDHLGDVYIHKGDNATALHYYKKGLGLEKIDEDPELKERLEKKVKETEGLLSA